jgi:hypothetical protein
VISIVIPIKKLSPPRHARAGGHPEFQALPVLLALDSRLRGSGGFLMGMAIKIIPLQGRVILRDLRDLRG